MQKIKYLSVLVAIILFFTNTTVAQPPTYPTIASTSGSGNSFPFGAAAGGNTKIQWLYAPIMFSTPLPTGQITKVWFRVYSGATVPTGGNYGNFTIKIGMTALTNLTTTYVLGLTQAYFSASQAIPAMAASAWFGYTLQTPIPYVAGSNFIVEVEHTGYSGTTWYEGNIAPVYVSRTFGPNGGTTGTAAAGYLGEMGFEVLTGPPCPVPTGLNATNILSASATMNWNNAASSTGYEYIVDQNPTVVPLSTSTPTPNTSVPVSGLTPGTNYYLHVRNICSPTNPSLWADYMFTTLPPCNEATGFNVTNLMPNSATINWAPLASALNWDYIVDQTYADPGSSTGATNVTSPTDNLSGLTANAKYYVHIRTNCTGEQSGWSLDSFTTPIPCIAPVVNIDHINTNEAVAYWEPVQTAFKYEYALTQSQDPPPVGTAYEFTAIHLPALNDGKQYFMHVRATCNSLGTISTSPWAKASFNTFPLDVYNTSKDGFSLRAYPNPAKDVLNIEIKGALSDKAGYTITDPSGKMVKQAALTSAKTEINLSELAAGIYMLKYTDGLHDTNIKVTKQ